MDRFLYDRDHRHERVNGLIHGLDVFQEPYMFEPF